MLHGREVQWREFAISEYDYATREARQILDNAEREARLIMVCDRRWKYVHCEGFRPMLFDMETDPDEFHDLGDSEAHREIIELMYARLSQWARRSSQRVTRSDQDILGMRGRSRRRGIVLGVFDGTELDTELTSKYRGKAARDYTRPEDKI